MYGKIFESLYSGSMVGAGSAMFAVWGYVIAKMRADVEVGAQVDLNPKLLAFILGETEETVLSVIEKLCSPDPHSTSKAEEGRRLIKLGEFSYRVVNGAKYMAIRNEEERREYHRLYKRNQRAGEGAGGNGKGKKPTKKGAEAKYQELRAGEAAALAAEKRGEEAPFEP